MSIVRTALPLALLTLATVAHADVLGVDLNGKAKAEAIIIDASGRPVGKAQVKNLKDQGMMVTVSVKGLTKGEHGIHLHTIGACEGPKFASAGGHWNPHGKMHGLSNPDGSHAGDMPNMLVKKNGRGTVSFEIAGGRVKGDNGLMDGDAAAIVIHAATDDQRTDPSGNSGERIACGIFVRK
jgi:Cu-Zn family superoxide dismutase